MSPARGDRRRTTMLRAASPKVVKLIFGCGALGGSADRVRRAAMRFRELKLPRDPECLAALGVDRELRDYDEYDDVLWPVEEVRSVTVEELKARMDQKTDFVLVDVREPSESQICSIPGAQLIPLGEFAERYTELPRDRPLVVHCRSGARSARAVHFLRGRGFTDVHNLEGGILAWIERIDPSQKRY